MKPYTTAIFQKKFKISLIKENQAFTTIPPNLKSLPTIQINTFAIITK